VSDLIQHWQERWIDVIFPGDVPPLAQQGGAFAHGLSVYDGVIVVWDRRYDPTILTWLDMLDDRTIENLALVCERGGQVALRWRHEVPAQYQAGTAVPVLVGADDTGEFTIVDSAMLGGNGEDPKPSRKQRDRRLRLVKK
jgi:hypothetical protein